MLHDDTSKVGQVTQFIITGYKLQVIVITLSI